jgi:E3 ubiquitin-protein ligase CCNP1IP1
MHLTNPDDVVVTNLNPTEDYKTSVLSGLNPHTIMECAGRALSFWAYQTAQEMFVAFIKTQHESADSLAVYTKSTCQRI